MIYIPEKMMIDLGGKEIRLSRYEAIVMQTLYHANGTICTVDDIGVSLYGIDGWYDGDVNESIIETYISRLRKRLTPYGYKFICTIKKVGWYFTQYEPDAVEVKITPQEATLLKYFRTLDPINQAMLAGSLNMTAQIDEAKTQAQSPRVSKSSRQAAQPILFDYAEAR